MSTRLLSAAARLRKLRAMNAPEIAHRLRYAALIAVERRQHASGRLAPADRLAKALRSDLCGAISGGLSRFASRAEGADAGMAGAGPGGIDRGDLGSTA